MICSPTGSPSAVKPQHTVTAGSAAWLGGPVSRWKLSPGQRRTGGPSSTERPPSGVCGARVVGGGCGGGGGGEQQVVVLEHGGETAGDLRPGLLRGVQVLRCRDAPPGFGELEDHWVQLLGVPARQGREIADSEREAGCPEVE